MTVNDLATALTEARTTLARLEPRPGSAHDKAAVGALVADVRRRLVEALPSAMADAAEDNRPGIRDAVLSAALDTVGLAFAADDDDAARRLLRDVRGLAVGSPLEVEVAAAGDAPRAFAWLTRGRWLHDKKKYRKAEGALRQALKVMGPANAASSSSTPTLGGGSASVRPATVSSMGDLITQALDAPRPLDSAPGLSTVNGIGQMLVGKRDVWSDGSYVSTLWFTVFFLPVIPLSAYRIAKDGGSYRFYFGTRLSTFAVWWRRGLLASAASGGLLLAGAIWWGSPDRRLAAACAEAEALAATDVDAAVRTVSAALITHSRADATRREQAASEALGWRLKSVTGSRDLQAVEQLVGDVALFPADSRSGLVAPVAAAVTTWVDDHGDAPLPTRLSLVQRAARVLPGATELGRRAEALEVESIMTMSSAWPAAAADRLSRLEGDAPLAALSTILAQVPSVGAVEGVADAARRVVARGADAALTATLTERLAALDARLTARAPVLAETATLKDRQAWLKESPDDQMVAAAVAVAAFEAGDIVAGEKVLLAAGPVGWWNPQLLALGSEVAEANGDVARAHAMLERAVSPRLAAFTDATKVLDASYRRIEDDVYARANAGTLAGAVKNRLQAASGDEERQRAILNEVITEQIDKSTEVKAARERLTALGPVVSQSLRLGGLSLRLAASVPPDAQPALLKAAEDAFISVAAFAGDDPRFQLGLGEVKYRTQQPEEGKKLLDAVVAQGDPGLTLSAGHVFRDVGAVESARGVANTLLAGATADAMHDEAVHLLLLMESNLVERERLVGLMKASTDEMEALRASVRAERFIAEGKFTEADRELAREAAIYEKTADHVRGAANNASLAWSRRFSLTGDPKALQKATSLMGLARKLSPTSPIVAANLLDLESRNAYVAVLAPHVDLEVLQGAVESVVTMASRPMEKGAPSLATQAKQKTSGNPRYRQLAEEVRTLAPSSFDAYRMLLGIYGHIDDEAGLRQLQTAIDNNAVDRTRASQAFQTRNDPGKVERARTGMTTELARLQAVRGGSAPTQAAVLVVTGHLLADLGRLDRDEVRIQAAIDTWTRAESLWPVLDTSSARSSSLTDLAMIRARASSPDLAALLAHDTWFNDGLLAVILSDGHSEARAALAARPEIAAALALRSPSVPSSRAFALARLLKDESAQRIHEPSLTSPANRLYRTLSATLSDFDPQQAAWAALADSR